MKLIKTALMLSFCLFNSVYSAEMAEYIDEDQASLISQDQTDITQLDITKISDQFTGAWRFMKWPAKLALKLFQRPILRYLHPLASDFRFDQTMPIAGLENTQGTCYAAALFQAMRVTLIREFVRARSGDLTTVLDDLFTAMETARDGIDDIKVHKITSNLLVPMLKEKNIQIRCLKNVESDHYSMIGKIIGNPMACGGASQTLFSQILYLLYEECPYESERAFSYRGYEGVFKGLFDSIQTLEEFILYNPSWEPNNTILPKLIVVSTDDNYESKEFEKLTGFAEFSEFLNFSYGGRKFHYRLVSAVIHHDRIPVIMPGNHNTALVWNKDNGQWYNANNGLVFYEGKFPTDFAKNYMPDMLFYQKID